MGWVLEAGCPKAEVVGCAVCPNADWPKVGLFAAAAAPKAEGWPNAEVDAGAPKAEVDEVEAAGAPNADPEAGAPKAEVDAGAPNAEGFPNADVDAG